ncbi:MAG: POTRA domain-containing protein [Ginsengibacter sp.]
MTALFSPCHINFIFIFAFFVSEKNHLFIIRKKILIVCCLSCINFAVLGQDTSFPTADSSAIQKLHPTDSVSKLRVRNVVITGNKKTKSYIILRELHFKTGDSILIETLGKQLQKAHDQIYNTTLFIEVKVTPEIINEFDFDIHVAVKERWYIIPIPSFQLADRSFNEWLVKYNGSLKRVNYGVRLYYYNISGRNDQLTLALINGFNRNISFEYKAPYTNSALSEGVIFGAGFLQTRQIPYKTDYNNNLIYYKNDDFVKNEWYVTAAYSSRKAIKKKEIFSVSFRHIKVDDSLLTHQYNPAYFNNTSSSQNFLEVGYRVQFTDVDNILYPLKGYATSLFLLKRGLELKGGINRFIIRTTFNKYFSHRHNWYSSARFTGQVEVPFNQPYINQRAVGYLEDYLRGDEYFAIDGVAFGLGKFDIKKRLLHFNIPTFLKSKTYNKLPFTIYGKTFFDAGYVYSQNNFNTRLNNRFLYSGGFGIDIITLYDYKLSIECSFNQLGQKGLFLHN